MNPRRDLLPEALRELAAGAPEASPELGARLSSAFARHHVQRRRKRAAIVVGLAACLVICGYWLWPHRAPETAKVTATSPQTAQIPNISVRQKDANVGHASLPQSVAPGNSEQSEAPTIAKTGLKPRPHPKQAAKQSNHTAEAAPVTADAGDFVALPSFDPAIPVGESRMVRMDLPGSALQLIGYPVEGQLLDRRILTDVLVGQDGMPYAVRLVRARNVH